LAVANLLKGELSFCCSEHRELFHKSTATEALERLRSSFEELAPKKPLPRKQTAAEAEAAEGWTHSRAEGWEEPLAAGQQPASPTEAAEERAVEELSDQDLPDQDLPDPDPPESSFIQVRLVPHDPGDPLLTSDGAEPIPAVAPHPMSPALPPPVPESLQRSLEVVSDIQPALAPADTALETDVPVQGAAIWADVPNGYPPVIMSTSAKLVLDLHPPEVMPLSTSLAGAELAGPGLDLEPPAIASLEPKLPTGLQVDDQVVLEQGTDYALKLHAAHYPCSLDAEPGSSPEPPALAGAEAGSSGFSGIVSSLSTEDRRLLLGLQSLRLLESRPISPKRSTVRFSTAIRLAVLPRRKATPRKAVQASPPQLSPAAFCPVSSTGIDAELPRPHVFPSMHFVAANAELPRVVLVLPSTSTGLKRCTVAAPIVLGIAATSPPAPDIEAQLTSTLPYLLISSAPCLSPAALHLSEVTRSLEQHVQPGNERRPGWDAARLLPSRPSPLSLISWSGPLSISIPVSRVTNLGKYAAIGITVSEGFAEGLRSPSARGYRVGPSIPEPQAARFAPDAPTPASISVPAIEPVRPGREGTEPPRLVEVRIQPAAMPVQQQRSGFPVNPAPTGLSLCSDVALELASVDAPSPRSAWVEELRTAVGTVLPGLERINATTAIRWAPYGEQVWKDAVLPATWHSPIPLFPPLRRLSRAVATALPEGSDSRMGRQLSRLARALRPGGKTDLHGGVRQNRPLRRTATLTGATEGISSVICP
jgi:hypothetical protein